MAELTLDVCLTTHSREVQFENNFFDFCRVSVENKILIFKGRVSGKTYSQLRQPI